MEEKTKKQLKDEKIQSKYSIEDYIPSPDDSRDYTVAKVGLTANVFPEEYRTEGNVKILNQGSIGSCVAHAIATAMAYRELKSGKPTYHNYSRGFIYGNRRDTDYSKEGMITRQALRQVNHDGDCLYSTFPWNEKLDSVKSRIAKNKDKYFNEAANYKIKSYFRCYTDEDIKATIMTQGAAILGMPLYEGFGKNVQLPKLGDKTTGGHVMCCVGWNKDGWIVQNSWSSIWGDKGYCYVPYEYPISEWWGITLNDNIPEPEKESWITKILKFINYYLGFIGKWLKSKTNKKENDDESNSKVA